MLWLVLLSLIQTLLYGSLYFLTDSFAYDSPEQSRPILAMLSVFAGSFVVYVAAVFVALRCPATPRLIGIVVFGSLVFRGILLPTAPLLEIDIYRYLWDGSVVNRSVNPYRFSPALIAAAAAEQPLPADLQELVRLRDSSPALADILHRIHFAHLPTVYPPVSQAVFALADVITPSDSSVDRRVLIMKSVLVLFDLGTIAILGLILAALHKHPGWLISYAWCPLVLKEIANTGHLDSIAVFFTTAAVALVVRLCIRTAPPFRLAEIVASGVVFGLAVGSKLYPLVLLPVLTVAVLKRVGLRSAVLYTMVAVAVSAVCLTPMLLTDPVAALPATSDVPAEKIPNSNSPPDTGLKAFLTQWEMNDFLFMLVVETLRPVDADASRPPIWFAVIPNAWRETVIGPLAASWNVPAKMAAFLAARSLTSLAFVCLAAVLAWRVYKNNCPEDLLEAVFLTLAWFWLLSPTQNAWYWLWALPFVPFARSRLWMAVSGLAFLYYLRFWFQYHFSGVHVLGTPYQGDEFFDFVVTWLEYVPWLLWLALNTYRRKRCASVRAEQ
jgi:hypothetical protein